MLAIFLFILFLSGIALCSISEDRGSSGGSMLGILLSVFSGFILVIVLIVMLDASSQYQAMVTKRATLEQIMNSGSEVSRASILDNVIEFNTDLELLKIQDKSFLGGDFVRNEIQEMKPIELYTNQNK